ncbi:MAG: hypothetical protein SFV24_16830 [Gemmatimonadales bacterium]|nr:hypothetical protein [Gemmatimonadales bacterium]
MRQLVAFVLCLICAGCRSTPPIATRGLAQWRGVKPGDEVVMVLIVSSQCRAAEARMFRRAVSRLADIVERAANARGHRMVTLGVSLDVRIEEGLRSLSGLGPFNEIAVGNSWMNRGAQTFIWETVPGQPAVPQVLVLSRSIALDGAAIAFGPYELLGRFIGAAEVDRAAVLHWVSVIQESQGIPDPRALGKSESPGQPTPRE